MRYLIYEIFEEFQKAKTRSEKIAVLRKHDNNALRSVLRGSFHPKIEYLVDSVPYYKPNILPAGMAGNMIGSEIRTLYLFEKGHPRCSKNFTDKQRKNMLIQILESLEAKEADVFMNMLLKDLRVPGLDREIVLEAFPGLLN